MNSSEHRIGGYEYALNVIEQKAKSKLKSKYKEIHDEEKEALTRKAVQDYKNKVCSEGVCRCTTRVPELIGLIFSAVQEIVDRELAVLEHKIRKFNVRRASENRLLKLKSSFKTMNRLARRGNSQALGEMEKIRRQHDTFKNVLKSVKVGAVHKDEELLKPLVARKSKGKRSQRHPANSSQPHASTWDASTQNYDQNYQYYAAAPSSAGQQSSASYYYGQDYSYNDDNSSWGDDSSYYSYTNSGASYYSGGEHNSYGGGGADPGNAYAAANNDHYW